jgi:predicted esterase
MGRRDRSGVAGWVLVLAAASAAALGAGSPRSDSLATQETRPGEPAADGEAPVEDLRAGGDPAKRFFLLVPEAGAKAPRRGFGLVVILPGGAGGEDFLGFVKNIRRHALSDEYLVAQLVSPVRAPEPKVVWPTSRNRAPGIEFTTEEFVEAVLSEVARRHRIDPKRTFLLAWSSGGPAAHAVILENRRVAGAFIAMSVFHPDLLPSLRAARGRAYYLLQSPEDKITPYRFAVEAEEALRKAGARVSLVSYEGGHGWHGDVYGHLRAGFEWLRTRGR